MGLALAMKRACRSFDPSPRRWVRRNYNILFGYLVGLYTGLLVTGHAASVTSMCFIALFVVLIALKRWAGGGHVVSN